MQAMAGGADILLIPEIPYDLELLQRLFVKEQRQENILRLLQRRKVQISKEEAALSKSEIKSKKKEGDYPSGCISNRSRDPSKDRFGGSCDRSGPCAAGRTAVCL